MLSSKAQKILGALAPLAIILPYGIYVVRDRFDEHYARRDALIENRKRMQDSASSVNGSKTSD